MEPDYTKRLFLIYLKCKVNSMLSLLNLASPSVNSHYSLVLPWGPLLTCPGSVHLPGSVGSGSQDGSGPEPGDLPA